MGLQKIALLLILGGIVIGPKELPVVSRQLGILLGRAVRGIREGREILTKISEDQNLTHLQKEFEHNISQIQAIRDELRFGIRLAPMPPSSSRLLEAPTTPSFTIPGATTATGKDTTASSPPSFNAIPQQQESHPAKPLPSPYHHPLPNLPEEKSIPLSARISEPGQLEAVGISSIPTYASPTRTDRIPSTADFIAESMYRSDFYRKLHRQNEILHGKEPKSDSSSNASNNTNRNNNTTS